MSGAAWSEQYTKFWPSHGIARRISAIHEERLAETPPRWRLSIWGAAVPAAGRDRALAFAPLLIRAVLRSMKGGSRSR